ncbi:restriction endonuclease subunit S [Paenibacillus alkalitolerans]|uniref:restriction endonuclease subunit S n=1 Tax=Paenibacillus alkalitolerans TaxID=2799335 RepID=UPI0018F62385|nr:restriction endonuclease subunit S [Paenibacillus alkalitolerans]
MTKADSSMRILAAAASIQWNIADILEAKAEEMESFRRWVTGTLQVSEFTGPPDLLQRSSDFHEQLIDIIAGMTKVEQGLSRHMQLLLEQEEESVGDNLLGSMMGFGKEEA